MTQKDIQSVLHEERSFAPSAAFTRQADLKPKDLEELHARAGADYVGFWSDLAREELHWHRPFTRELDDTDAPNFRWFTDGLLNASYNCLDVHLAARGDKTAIVFEGEPGDTRRISYRELHAEVCRFANVLKAQGVIKGDRVVIYMPLIPEAVVAMQACARIGALHSVVFGGFSAHSLADRINDAGAKLLVTADGGWRGGHAVALKAAADKALGMGCPSIERVIVFKRTGHDCEMHPGRDLWWQDLMDGQQEHCDPEWVDAEHPLYLLYTSGSTGRPKGIQHATAGYLLQCKLSTRWVFDLKEHDVFWCTADIGWVTGHSYVVYGPLACGATLVMYEGAPTVPDGGRFWKICQNHGVTVFYTAPTAIRALMKLGDAVPKQYDLTRLRLLGSVGEPINPEAWMWYHRVIGAGRCPIVDTWWQTETGAIMISPVPGVTATKPGSCTRPLPGIFADIVDDEGRSVTKSDAGGYLVIKRPWPGMLRTIWGDNARYLRTYWEKFQNRFYVAGDSAHRDADGFFWIMGRIDDVLNVAGHRLGTMEIESALVAHARVAEAAVVGKQHEIKGESVFAYVVLKGARPEGEAAKALADELRQWVSEELSPIARPDDVLFTDNLPKTRSGKIMRRLLRALARGEAITQDVSTLENPAILEQLRGFDAGPAKTVGKPAAKAHARRVDKRAAKRPAKPSAKRAGKLAVKKPGKTSVKRAASKSAAKARKPDRRPPESRKTTRRAAATKSKTKAKAKAKASKSKATRRGAARGRSRRR